jgi:hypothetical protein
MRRHHAIHKLPRPLNSYVLQFGRRPFAAKPPEKEDGPPRGCAVNTTKAPRMTTAAARPNNGRGIYLADTNDKKKITQFLDAKQRSILEKLYATRIGIIYDPTNNAHPVKSPFGKPNGIYEQLADPKSQVYMKKNG